MAGAQLAITVDDAAVRRLLTELIDRSQDLLPVFDEVGSMLAASTQQRFEDEEDPEGRPWPELAASTQRKRVTKRSRRGKDHILRSQGHLYNSITHLARRSDLQVGTNRRYGALHQFGGGSDMPPGPAAVPARAYLGLSGDDEKEIAEILLDHLGGRA